MNGWVAIDGGQSAVRLCASWHRDVVAGPGYAHGANRTDELVAAIRAAVADLGPWQPVDVVAMGHTGLPAGPAERTRVAAALGDLFEAAEVRICQDWLTAHAGALNGSPGVVTSAGTGAVSLAIGADGAAHKVDGWGHLFGDRGSAFAIGRAGLEIALRHLDGRQHAPDLYAAATGHFGSDLRLASWRCYASPTKVDDLAQFAPSVVRAAAAGGAAGEVVSAAVDELVLSITTAVGSIGGTEPVAVCCVGRLFDAGEVISEPLRDRLSDRCPRAQLTEPCGGPLDGAVLLAQRIPPIFDRLIIRHERQR